MKRRLGLLFVLSCAIAPAGCESTEIFRGNPSESPVAAEEYVSGPAPLVGVELDALWDRAGQVLAMDCDGVDSERSSFADREMVSHWITLLAPNRFEGKRSRAWVKFREVAPGSWVVSAAVQTQRNVDIDQPSAASQAKWEEVASNQGRADLIVWKIESGFRDAPRATKPK